MSRDISAIAWDRGEFEGSGLVQGAESCHVVIFRGPFLFICSYILAALLSHSGLMNSDGVTGRQTQVHGVTRTDSSIIPIAVQYADYAWLKTKA